MTEALFCVEGSILGVTKAAVHSVVGAEMGFCSVALETLMSLPVSNLFSPSFCGALFKGKVFYGLSHYVNVHYQVMNWKYHFRFAKPRKQQKQNADVTADQVDSV